MLTALCAGQGVAQVAIDLNRTHATHPAWTRHARFHVVWQSITVALLSFVELWLILASGPQGSLRMWIACVLAGVSPMAFLGAFLFARCYNGALSDPGGIPPFVLSLRSRTVRIDGNLIAVLIAFVVIACFVWLVRT